MSTKSDRPQPPVRPSHRPAPQRAKHPSKVRTAKYAAIEADLFAFLQRKYSQSQDERQKAMDLTYTTAETHDLASEVARFLEQREAAEAETAAMNWQSEGHRIQ